MTTIVNTPAPSNETGGYGLIIGVIVLLFVGILFFYYGLPAIRGMSTPQINVPNQIDVNVKQAN